ncbi:MAG TPA: glycosyltransferase [Pyrinomonadaceae bacterium]|nr:glycosyltransferase [Pyrinomonadaceae bacterium]
MWPPLLYVGDVPVESTYHGSALLHRLLANYPAGKLTIIETAVPSQPDRRLAHANYLSYPLNRSRWLHTRFHPHATAWFSYRGATKGPRIAASLNGTRFEAILTVAHGFGWLAAARMAEQRRVPLHLMVHDDWPRAAHVPNGCRDWLDREFARVYCQAQSRMCVSPSMQREYQSRYGATAEVLYPSRAAGLPRFDGPPERLGHNDHQFTIAFAGTINSPGYTHALIALSDALATVNGRLLIFGPLTSEHARQTGLDLPNVTIGGLLNWHELMTRLRNETDVLFIPMSFDAVDRSNMELAFPSKLADCTAVGLPLLIYGPEYCSAVRWARENRGVAEVVQAQESLGEVVRRLANDPRRRFQLGTEALNVGKKYFAHEAVREVFIRALTAA